MMNPVILRLDEAGVLRDQQGQVCNEHGQRLDGEGNPIAEVAIENAGGNLQQNAPAARPRTLGDYNRPDEFYANRSAIRLPTFERNDFELKPSYYSLVGQHPFHGLSHENPMDHIERFEDLVTSMKYNGVNYDYLFCKLFPHSLAGDAAYWLKQLPTGSLHNWDDTKKAFLRNFYDDARSEDLRNKISQFTQGPTEAFKSSWVRFRAYQRDCPHHGFSEVQLLGIFFRGIDWRYQMALDSASNGNFNTRSPAEACVLIENLASSNSTKNADFERQKNVGAMDGKQIAELKNKLDSVHNILVNKKTVHFAQEVETFEPEKASVEQDCNYVGGNGFQGQRYGNQQGRGNFSGYGQKGSYTGNQNSFQKPLQSNSGFTRNYGSSSYQAPPPQTEQSEMKAMIEQILEGQQKITVDLNGKLDAVYTDLNTKFETLSSHVKKLDTQVAQIAGTVTRQEGALPGRTDANPKYQCNAVTSNSGKKALSMPSKDNRDRWTSEQNRIEAEYEPTEVVSIDTLPSVSIDTKAQESHGGSVDRHPYLGSIGTQIPASWLFPEISVDRHSCVSIDTNPPARWLSNEVSVDRHHPTCVDRHQPLTRAVHKPKVLYPHEQATRITEERVYKPKLPYPRAPKLSSTVTQSNIPKKLEDPGSFVLDCSISQNRFKSSLCDLGSGVSLMPLSVALRLGMTNFTPTRISLILADKSVRIPEGILEDVPVKIGDCTIPTDFVVLEYSDEPQDPLILGRPFLATAGALIDVRRGNIALKVGSRVLSFDMKEQAMHSTIDGQTFCVNTAPTSDYSVEVPKVELKQPPDGLRITFENGARSAVWHQRTDSSTKKQSIFRDFEPSDQVPLYQSCLQLSSERLRSCYSGPHTIDKSKELTMHDQEVKHNWAKAKIPDGHNVRLDYALPP